MKNFISQPSIIIGLIFMALLLLYMFFYIVKGKLLFKSAVRGTKRSLISIIFLTILYTISFSLVDGVIMFNNRTTSAIDTMVKDSNYHQLSLKTNWSSGFSYEWEDKNNDPYYINYKKWEDELIPTMNDMHNKTFIEWDEVKQFIISQPGAIPNKQKNKNELFYKEFLNIWQYQNTHYDINDTKKTLPQLDFGYKGMTTMNMSLSNDNSKKATALRMEPETTGINSKITDTSYEVNKPLLKEGKLPLANNPNDGMAEVTRTEVSILSKFGYPNHFPIGSDIDFYATKDKIPYPPITNTKLYAKVSGYSEISELAYFLPSIFSIIPDYLNQTFVLIPYKSFNKIAELTQEDISYKSQINISFKDNNEKLQNKTKLKNIDVESKESSNIIFSKEISSFFRINENNKYYDEGLNETEKNLILNQHKSMVFDWRNTSNSISKGIPTAISITNMNSISNKIMMLLFLIINIIFIFMVLKRKINMLSKEVGVLKSLGYNSRIIASSFISYVMIIVIIGGLMSLGFGMLVQQSFTERTMNFFAMSIPPAMINFEIILLSMLLPFCAISIFVWVSILFTIKKPTTSLLNNVSINKPNNFIKKTSLITMRMNFINAYIFKNGMRATGKSLAILMTITFSTIMLTFGILMGNFSKKASDTTMSILNYDSKVYVSSGQDIVLSTKDKINYYTEYDVDDKTDTKRKEYSFGAHRNYWNKSEIDSDMKHIFNGSYEPKDMNHLFKAWEYDVTKYMRDTEIIRNQTAFTNNLLFNSSYINTARLYTIFKTSNNSHLISQPLTYYDSNNSNNQEYKNITMSTVFTVMSQISSSLLKNQDTNIVFDMYEQNSPTIENGTTSNSVKASLINGKEIKEIGFAELDGYNLTFANDETLNNNFLELEENNQNLNNKLLNQKNSSPNYSPILIDKPFSKIYNINKGDIITVQYSYDLISDINDSNALKAEFKVAGIYDSYMKLGWFVPSEDNYAKDYQQKLYEYNRNNWGDTTNGAWYNYSSSEFKMKDLVSDIMVKNDDIKKSFTCITSGTLDNEFSLLSQDDSSNPLSSMLLCDTAKLSKSVLETFAKDSIAMINDSLEFFIIFAYLVVIFILMVISNETIQSSKREVSTLKALGYGPGVSSKIVLTGQVIIMALCVSVAIPLTLFVLNILSSVLSSKAGMFIEFIPNPLEIITIIGIILFVSIITYILGYIVYKNTSQLEALQRE